MPRPRRQLSNAVLVDAGKRVEATQVWFTPAALARHLGRVRSWVGDQEKIRPLYRPRRGPDGILYHIEQVRLIDAVIAGNRTEAEATEIWEMKRKLIGVTHESN